MYSHSSIAIETENVCELLHVTYFFFSPGINTKNAVLPTVVAPSLVTARRTSAP